MTSWVDGMLRIKQYMEAHPHLEVPFNWMEAMGFQNPVAHYMDTDGQWDNLWKSFDPKHQALMLYQWTSRLGDEDWYFAPTPAWYKGARQTIDMRNSKGQKQTVSMEWLWKDRKAAWKVAKPEDKWRIRPLEVRVVQPRAVL
jgi:hypothetical protein